MQHLEFTIEPFVEGKPGPHVVAAVAAVADLGAEVDFGPFGSSCTVDAALMPDVVAGRDPGRLRQRRDARQPAT